MERQHPIPCHCSPHLYTPFPSVADTGRTCVRRLPKHKPVSNLIDVLYYFNHYKANTVCRYYNNMNLKTRQQQLAIKPMAAGTKQLQHFNN
jgi:hypothetical protein